MEVFCYGKGVGVNMSYKEANELKASLMRRKKHWWDIFIPSTKMLRRFIDKLDRYLPPKDKVCYA